MQEVIREILDSVCPAPLYEYGFAGLRGLLPAEYSGFDYGISLVRKLDDDIIDGIRCGPTPAYYAHYNEINAELNEKLRVIGAMFEKRNIRYFPVRATVENGELDEDFMKTLRFSVSHKMVATRAGLGWIGKTDLFVSRRFGPRVRMASLLIDAFVEPAVPPLDASACGNCSKCVDACPVRAANGILWDTGTDRNVFFDPFKCMENCRRLSRLNLHAEESLCGICISVCPKGLRTNRPGLSVPAGA